uniref:F-box/kelch-repeat protein OR23-like n=1 Tax=Erigeron canadensis TaxID=72917 RepID=UPI001CB9CE50|nr:F-box/kelch-repeat protein OR23-like [Erigeron canadensis]
MPNSSELKDTQLQLQTLTLSLTLIPGLPHDLAALILAYIPYCYHDKLKSISKSWKQFFSSKIVHSIRRKLVPDSKVSHLLCIFPQDPLVSSPYVFDCENGAWCCIPPMPCNPHVYGLCNFVSISYGSSLYVIGGSVFDTRSFPLDRPSPSDAVYRYDFVKRSWDVMPSMIAARGSFACAAVDGRGRIVVAGGGSRHALFGAAGSRMSDAEMFDIGRNEWVALDGLPRFRAGCVGFIVGNEFWVMGGYGESRTIMGVFPVDDYYKNAVVMPLKNGGFGSWREVGDMWEEGDRSQLGRIAVVEDANGGFPGIFMLDKNEIFRYEMTSNRWWKETTLPKRAIDESAVGFVALNGELLVLACHNGNGSVENRRLRRHKRLTSLFLQIYHPGYKIWRTLITKPPVQQPIDFKTAVMCTIRL